MTTIAPDPAVIDRAAEFSLRLAQEAGELALQMSADFEVAFKSARDLVTTADTAVEKLISESIKAEFPEHRMLGEEGAVGASESDWRWLVDPIDGTTNYAHRYPSWCVSICLEHRGEPVVGTIVNPVRNETFHAALGKGATLNGAPIHVSDVKEMIHGIFAVEIPLVGSDPEKLVAVWLEAYKRMQGVRINGSAALTLCDVACGRIDGYWQRSLCNYDIGAGVIIAREAGATVSAMSGDPYILDNREVCCTNGHLHDEILAFIVDTEANTRARKAESE